MERLKRLLRLVIKDYPGFILYLASALMILLVPYAWARGFDLAFKSLVYLMLLVLLGIYAWIWYKTIHFNKYVMELPKLFTLLIETTLVSAAMYMWLVFFGPQSQLHGFESYYAVFKSNDRSAFITASYARSVLSLTVDALHFSVVTGATVGYGDMYPISRMARVLVDFQIVYTFIIVVLGIGKYSDKVADTSKGVANNSAATTANDPVGRQEKAASRIFNLLRTASPEANFLLLTSSLLLLIKILILDSIGEFFDGAHALGVITEAILASVIASYIFYLVVVHLTEAKNKATVHPYIAKHAQRVVGTCRSQLAAIGQMSGVTLNFETLRSNDVFEAFKRIPPTSAAPLVISLPTEHGNWVQYFSYNATRTKASIRRLLDQLPLLDAKLIRFLTAIDDCSHFESIEMLGSVPILNTDLSAFASSFYEYCCFARDLAEHLASPAFQARARGSYGRIEI